MPAPDPNPATAPVMGYSQSSALTMGFAEAAGSHSIGIVMLNAAQVQQAVQQIEVAALGYVLAKMAAAAGQ
jgi:hypothetical protein